MEKAKEKKEYISVVGALLDKVLKSEERPIKKKRKFSASQAGMCQRSVILNKLGVPHRTPLTPQQRRVFFIGTALHEALIAKLVKTGEIVAYEKYVGEQNDIVVGSFDFILRDGPEHVLYDLKNVSESSFWSTIKKLYKEKSGPPKGHVYQLVTYWILNKKYRIDSIKMYYMSKENGNEKEFEVNITEELIKEVEEWWKSTHSYLEKKELPMVQPTEELQKAFYCNSCQFRDFYCFPSETVSQEQIITNISEIDWSDSFDKQMEIGPKEQTKV